jgi:uncharacterized RmlC-like cupin family protein
MGGNLVSPTQAPETDVASSARVALVRPTGEVSGKQGLDYAVGISAESVGSQGLHLQTLTMPPGARSRSHKHPGHETAIYAIAGVSGCWFAEGLTEHIWLRAGEFLYIPAGTPHLPHNPSASETFVAVIARTDPWEQEHVELLPELDGLPHLATPPRA